MDIIQHIKKRLKKIDDSRLRLLLGISNQTYNKYKEKGLTEKELARVIIRLIVRNKIEGKHFTDQLKKKFKIKDNKDLENELGLTQQAFYGYEKRLIGVSEVHAIIKKSRDHFAENAIRPLVEFYPLNKEESKGGSSYELFNVTKNSDTRENKLKLALEERNGIYLFYNSQGQVIYVGKARDQGLWNEMKSAFNRERTDQEVYKVNHPTTGSDFDLAYIKPRQIVRQSVKLHDIAAYFSAYQVEAALIDHMEAAIIRMIPNDCLNVKIEKIHINKT